MKNYVTICIGLFVIGCSGESGNSKQSIPMPKEIIDLGALVTEQTPEEFWGKAASALDWTKPWEKVLDDSGAPFYEWFSGGDDVSRRANSFRR